MIFGSLILLFCFVIYAVETYPSEVTRAELSEKLGLTDRQLQMWFCHRRLKDKNTSGGTEKKPRAGESGGRRNLTVSPREDLMVAEAASDHGSGSASRSGSGSGSSRFDNGDGMPTPPIRYYESPRRTMERRVIACIEAQLGEPLREDGPILGVEFDELPPGAFGTPIGKLIFYVIRDIIILMHVQYRSSRFGYWY